ncbi:MAG: hypothetical protein JSV50_06510 [Desulfobacteraceae bacterium]|nr:MAG: hypothetical protein JSV50_06510 [Desulfobacteraceae bacterium]
MKKIVLVLLVLFLVFPVYSNAEEFLGAPVIPEGEVIQKTDSRLEIKIGLSHAEVLGYYKEALKEAQDIKFREWKDATYIEDDGKLAWHSITISKQEGSETSVVIMKDNWTWIIGTLILRYIGVFAVLLVLFLGMSVSGRIISGVIKKAEAKKAAA